MIRSLLGFIIGYLIALFYNYIKRRKNKREEKPNCIGCKDLDFYNTGEAYCIKGNKCNEGCYTPDTDNN